MKATGIVRRVDDLGRVVIPKEIRRTMRIRDGEPLEIYTSREGEVIFKKYSPLGEFANHAESFADAISKAAGMTVTINDRDAVVACAGGKKRELQDKPLSADLEKLMSTRQTYIRKGASAKAVKAVDGADGTTVSLAVPIITEGDLVGSIALIGEGASVGDAELKLAQAAAIFLGRQFEN
jgi:AbrB family transcriptional regulator (stage V sporulation protein T)